MPGKRLELRKSFRQECIGFFNVLWDDSGLSKNRHEIAVTGPTWDDMHMDMVGDTGAGSPAKAPANVKALGATHR